MKQPHDTDGITPASIMSTSLTNTHITTHVNTREAIADDIATFGKMNMKRELMRGGEDPNKK